MRLHHLLVLILIMSMAAPGWGQTTEPRFEDTVATDVSVATAQTDQPTPSHDAAPYVPAPVNGEAPSLRFQSESESSNMLIGSIRVGATYDDNILSSSTSKVGDVGYMITPSLAAVISRPRFRGALSYSPGLGIYQRASQYNRVNQNLGADLQFRVSPHISIRLRDSFYDTTNPFDQLGENPYMPGIGPLHQPNQSVITPIAHQTGNVATADIAYQFGPNSMVGASTTISRLHYQDVAGSSSAELISTHSNSVDGFYAYHVSRRHWIGVDYDFNDLSFRPGWSETVAHTVLLYDTISLTNNMTLSVFAGPQHWATQGETVEFLPFGPFLIPVSFLAQDQAWSWSGGATYKWQGNRTALVLSFNQRISDGGGLLSAVREQNVEANVRRRLSSRLTGMVGISLANNRLLGTSTSSLNQIQSLSARCGLEYRLRQNISLNLDYERDRQRYGTLANHNRVAVGLSYRFMHSLGR